jgi:hypothetical protein
LPEFDEREGARAKRKHEELAPFIEQAMRRKENVAPSAEDKIPSFVALGRQVATNARLVSVGAPLRCLRRSRFADYLGRMRFMLATSIPQGSKHLVIAPLLVDWAISDGIRCDRTRLNEAIGIQTFSWSQYTWSSAAYLETEQ